MGGKNPKGMSCIYNNDMFCAYASTKLNTATTKVWKYLVILHKRKHIPSDNARKTWNLDRVFKRNYLSKETTTWEVTIAFHTIVVTTNSLGSILTVWFYAMIQIHLFHLWLHSNEMIPLDGSITIFNAKYPILWHTNFTVQFMA